MPSQQIPDSELILNPDGSIYHLELLPGEIGDIVFTVGDPGRVGRVSRYFDRIDVIKAKREFITHTGKLNERRLSVISTGIGPDNIDIVLNELDALVNIDFDTRRIKEKRKVLDIIRIGTSGGLQPDLPVDGMVAARFGLGLDNLLHFYEYRSNLAEAELHDELMTFQEYAGRLPVRPYVTEGSAELFRQVGSDMHPGITVTAPGFYGPQGRRLRLATRLNRPLLDALSNFSYRGSLRITNFEMETAALYGLARLLGHRALSCNLLLVNRPKGKVSADPKAGIDRLIRTVLERACDCRL